MNAVLLVACCIGLIFSLGLIIALFYMRAKNKMVQDDIEQILKNMGIREK